MGQMTEKPQIYEVKNGGFVWEHCYETFSVKVYTPPTKLDVETLNYGFIAPYLVVMEEEKMSVDEAILFAKRKGFSKLASSYASSVIFIYPNSENGWTDASKGILSELYSNSKIHEYFDRGVVINNNRFTKTIDGYFIRGAIFRMCLYGFGKSADFIAEQFIGHFEGDGLWGRSDLAPILCSLERLSVQPVIRARDIPIMSVGNSDEMNAFMKKETDYFFAIHGEGTGKNEKGESYDSYVAPAYKEFGKQFRRMLGEMEIDPDLEKDGLVIEPGIVTLKTSPDNIGDDKGTAEHKVGFFAFYNPAEGKRPLLLCFHGGGDSAFYISYISGWARLAHKYGFLLVSIENHLNSTATEMKELLEILKEKYDIDETRIYASGFSMGGCKTWDIIQEYPDMLAAAAPMDATFEVGDNSYGEKIRCNLNKDVSVPVFYTGGEITPLPELPFQEKKCYDRMKYVLELNQADKEYAVSYDEKEKWENPIWGIYGDEKIKKYDPSRDSTLTMELFYSRGKVYNVFGSISGQGHECRPHTCEHAWRFLRCFKRENGKLVGGDIEEIRTSLSEE